jgi:hypothetical protein
MFQTKEDLDRLKKEVYTKPEYPLEEVREYLYQMMNPRLVDNLILEGQKSRYGLRLRNSLIAADLFKLIFIMIEMTHDVGLWRNEKKCLKLIAWLEKTYHLV